MNTRAYRPHSVRWIGSRSGPTFCQPWSRSKIVCKVISIWWRTSPLSGSEKHAADHILCCNMRHFSFPIKHLILVKPQRLAQMRKLARQPPCMVVDEGWPKSYKGLFVDRAEKNIHRCLLSSVDNLCKHFGSSSGPTKYHTVWHPDGKLILKEFLNTFNFEEANRQTTKMKN